MLLALRMLSRNWRSGELQLLSFSIVLAVAVLSAIAIFSSRMENTILQETNAVLGADFIVQGSLPIKAEWRERANRMGVEQANAIGFMTMVYNKESSQLASVKAVDTNYPLRGEFEISFYPESSDQKSQKVTKGPLNGETWVDERLFNLLSLRLGDELQIGDRRLKVAAVLLNEPDALSPASFMGSRLIMSLEDVAATGLIAPGSVISYQWSLADSNSKKLEELKSLLKDQLGPHYSIRGIESSQERLSRTQGAAKKFLLLTGIIAVLLAGVAISIASRQFAERHINQVALLKSLGASSAKIRYLYVMQLIVLASLASGIGLFLGYIVHLGIALSASNLFHTDLASASVVTYILSYLSGIFCLICFSLPSLWHLTRVPPIKIFRRELDPRRINLFARIGIAVLAVVALIGVFSRDLIVAGIMTLGLMLLVLVAVALTWLLMRSVHAAVKRSTGALRLALHNLKLHADQSLIQVLVFGIAMMLLVTMVILRSSLIADWKVQVPDNAPNVFVTSVPEEELEALNKEIEQITGMAPEFMPNVRGRLIEINNQLPTDELRRKHNALQRELNLTMSSVMAPWNDLVDGSWWSTTAGSKGLPGVSVELETAKALGIKIGDHLTFSIGGLQLQSEVKSLRRVDWRSMQLNYFFIFEPDTLNEYSPNFMAAIFVDPKIKVSFYRALQAYPRVMLIDVGRIIETIKRVIDQLSNALSFTLGLTLLGGILVLWASVLNTQAARLQESGLLRALGASKRLIQQSVIIEFGVLGFLAGIVAVIGAESLLMGLQHFVFKSPVKPHFLFWGLTPLITGFVLASLGYWGNRHIIETPPAVVLREAAT